MWIGFCAKQKKGLFVKYRRTCVTENTYEIWQQQTHQKNKKFSPEFFAKNYGIYEVTYKSYAVMNKRFKKIYCKFK